MGLYINILAKGSNQAGFNALQGGIFKISREVLNFPLTYHLLVKQELPNDPPRVINTYTPVGAIIRGDPQRPENTKVFYSLPS